MITQLVAIVSPSRRTVRSDFDALRRLIEWHVEEGTNAIVVVGTTGESPTVDPREHGELVQVRSRRRAARSGGRRTGANSTREAIELTAHAKRVGADATLQVVPYYNKPTQGRALSALSCDRRGGRPPIILYNVPGGRSPIWVWRRRSGLAQVPGIVGLKDATGDLARAGELLRRLPSNSRCTAATTIRRSPTSCSGAVA